MRTGMALGVPGLLSYLIHGDVQAEVKGLQEFAPEDRPPVRPTYWSYRAMIFLAGWFVVLGLWGAYLLWRGRVYTNRPFLIAALYSMLLPLAANELGWIAAEIGRQPWIVQGLLRTQAAASPLPAYQILLSLILFTVVYSALGAGVVYLVRRQVQKAMGEEASVSRGVLPASANQ
jgi:cytochrome d ubiquinol oxidase subunit I